MLEKRNTNIVMVLFPVEEEPIFLQISKKQHNTTNTDTKISYNKVPRFKAIVDKERGHVFSVVADSYRLITNEKAINLGEECFKQLFSQSTINGMEVFNITMPRTRSFCHIDFIHKDYFFEPWKDDPWLPFLRITNSYNRTKRLRFDFGFCRSICTNGLIFGQKGVSVSIIHTKGEVRRINFDTSLDELRILQTNFIEKLYNLKRYYVPKDTMFPLLCKVFNISFNESDLKNKKRNINIRNFYNHVQELTDKYVYEMGPTGYAALNIISDFASRPSYYTFSASMVNQLQQKSTDWIDEFLKIIGDKNFNFRNYLNDFEEQAALML